MKLVGHVQDIETSINTSYLVLMSGVQAQAFIDFMATIEFTPSQPVANITTFMLNDRDYRVAKRGHPIQADLSLECLLNARGNCYCPVRRRRYNKITYLCPQVFNPMIINFYNPDGTTDMRPAHDHPRPDRNIKIPINLIIIDDFSSLTTPYIPAPDYHNPQPGPSNRGPPGNYQGPTPGNLPRLAPNFRIYLDNPTSDASQNSSTSTNSNTFPDLTTTLHAGLMEDRIAKAQRDQVLEGFSPAATSTETPNGNAQKTVKVKITPSKVHGKSKKGLHKTPSQPSITDFTTKNGIPSPIPVTSAKKRKAKSQNDTKDGKRPVNRNIMTSISDPTYDQNMSIMTEDSSITKAKSTLDQSAIDFFTANKPDNEQVLDLYQLQGNQNTDSTESSLPSKTEFDVTTPSQSSLSSGLVPFDPKSESSTDLSRQGTSNPPGKFSNDDQDSTDSNQKSSSSAPVFFNAQDALVARAEMLRAPRPHRQPPPPDHILIVVEQDEVISELLYFFTSHDPLDILEAYWNQSIDYVVPDEGIETTAESTPPAPPPTPTSSTEAQHGSSDNDDKAIIKPVPTEVSTDADSSVEVTEIVIKSDVQTDSTIEISDQSSSENERKGEEEEGEEKRGGHTN